MRLASAIIGATLALILLIILPEAERFAKYIAISSIVVLLICFALVVLVRRGIAGANDEFGLPQNRIERLESIKAWQKTTLVMVECVAFFAWGFLMVAVFLGGIIKINGGVK